MCKIRRLHTRSSLARHAACFKHPQYLRLVILKFTSKCPLHRCQSAQVHEDRACHSTHLERWAVVKAAVTVVTVATVERAGQAV